MYRKKYKLYTLLIQYTNFNCIKKLHFKTHSDTTLLCSVQGVFLNFYGKNSLHVNEQMFRQEKNFPTG